MRLGYARCVQLRGTSYCTPGKTLTAAEEREAVLPGGGPAGINEIALASAARQHPRRVAEHPAEGAGHVRLVGKADAGCDVGKRAARQDQRSGPPDPELLEIGMGRQAEARAE